MNRATRIATLATLLAATGAAGAQGFNHAPRDALGWHGSGGVQVHHRSQEAQLPWLGVWTRAPVQPEPGSPPGWIYVKVLINCEDWYALPFGMAAAPGAPLELISDVTGSDPVPQPATRGGPLAHLVLGLCSQFGFLPPDRRPLRGFPSGTVTR